jgi:branched-chain amino acid transport system ATP-binding protein
VTESEPTTKPDTKPAQEAGASLVVRNLAVRYGGVQAVTGLSFRVAPGESLGIIGSNGAGKTSTLKAIMGHVSSSADEVRYGSCDLQRTAPQKRVRHGIAYVPEGRHVFAGLSVEKNLMLGAYTANSKSESAASLEQVHAIFPVLQEMRNRLAGALSGGQQQMLAIGRALMSRPSLMLLDEPSMGLSPKLVDEIVTVIGRLRQERISILLVEQNAKLTFASTDRCVVMENGAAVMEGRSTDLSSDPRVRAIYLGL